MSQSTAPPALQRSRLVERSPVYYGWVALAAATFAFAMTLPGQSAGVALFLDPILAELGLARSTVSLAYTIATVVAALSLATAGRLVDRYGPRRGVSVVAALFGLTLVGMSRVEGLIGLFLAFVMLRALGPGALSLVSQHVVNLWFVRRRGFAIGCMGVGLALAMAVGPGLIEAVMARLGWRGTLVALGVVMLGVLLPVGALLFRAQPERFGLIPDGRTPPDDPLSEAAFSLSAARRTPIFWLLTLGGVSVGAIGTGLLFHHFSILAQNGLPREAAALVFVPYGIVSAAATLGAGVGLDRFSPRFWLAGSLLLFGTMVMLVPLVTTTAGVLAYGVVFGGAQGVQGALIGSAYAHYFGRAHIGAIKGYTKMLFVGGTALGPFVFGYGFDLLGSYVPVMMACALVPLAIGLASLRAPEPAREA